MDWSRTTSPTPSTRPFNIFGRSTRSRADGLSTCILGYRKTWRGQYGDRLAYLRYQVHTGSKCGKSRSPLFFFFPFVRSKVQHASSPRLYADLWSMHLQPACNIVRCSVLCAVQRKAKKMNVKLTDADASCQTQTFNTQIATVRPKELHSGEVCIYKTHEERHRLGRRAEHIEKKR